MRKVIGKPRRQNAFVCPIPFSANLTLGRSMLCLAMQATASTCQLYFKRGTPHNGISSWRPIRTRAYTHIHALHTHTDTDTYASACSVALSLSCFVQCSLAQKANEQEKTVKQGWRLSCVLSIVVWHGGAVYVRPTVCEAACMRTKRFADEAGSALQC